ncbi:hypothetical protein [Verticiella sediminum]|uniref:hypothetical protein n=1 Tax=Verticiella sediminum TaxID=1247510 RepID=UPI0014785383|nr:hypothetical protein [Verticiella sediminum]
MLPIISGWVASVKWAFLLIHIDLDMVVAQAAAAGSWDACRRLTVPAKFAKQIGH